MSKFGKTAVAALILLLVAGTLFANEAGSITEVMANLVLQIGIILFAVRLGSGLVKKLGIPSVLGELLAGIVIGPFALGGIALPGFPHGIFPVASEALAVSPELYAFSTVASIILLFASGLETDLGLFLRYSFAGGLVGIGGAIFSFVLGALVAVFAFDVSFMDPLSLFLGIMSTATSVGITARILSDQKKMDSPEGVTTLAAAVFDDVLGIILLAVVMGIVAMSTGSAGSTEAISGFKIGMIALKAFGIWLGFTVLGLIFYRQLGALLKKFKHSYDFSVMALGIALLLAGIFEKQGLAMIIGAYIAGLSLSKTDIAAVIQERIHGLYEFFVPLFFAVMGMLVNVKEIMNVEVLVIGGIYSVLAILAKVIGCGIPALSLGFNMKGAFRIGAGMVPRGEVALIIAGIGLAAGVLDEKLFGITILMTLVTTLLAPPILNFSLKIPGTGMKKAMKEGTSASVRWEFPSDEIADLVVDILLKDLRMEGFYVQMMNIDEGLSQARKGDISLSILEEENIVQIETNKEDLNFIKTAVYEVIVSLHDSIDRLKSNSDPETMRKELSDLDGRSDKDILKLIQKEGVCIDLKATTKEGILGELIDILVANGKVSNRAQVLADVLQREHTMSTGMQHGIALPHAKSDGIKEVSVAVGLAAKGVEFESIDGEPCRLFIMIVSPKKISGPHIQFLSAIGGVLKDDQLRTDIMAAKNAEEVVSLFNTR